MREILVRTAGPASLLIVELEAPTRLLLVANREEMTRLAGWHLGTPRRAALLACALDEAGVLDGTARGREWSQVLGSEPGGVVEAIEGLLARR